MDKSTKFNKKNLRILQKKSRSCCNECLYVQYNTLPPVQLFNFQVLTLVHKTLFTPHLLPAIFQLYFSLNKSFHGHNTRNWRLHLTRYQSHLRFHSLKFTGSQLWNRLPQDLMLIPSSASFRKLLKNYLLYNPM